MSALAGLPRGLHYKGHSTYASTARSAWLRSSRPGRCTLRTRRVLARAGDDAFVMREPKTGTEFPKTISAWQPEMDTMRLLGVGCREKKVLLFNAKVYAIACYIEGAKAAKEFGIRARGGFFQDAGISDYADAVLDAACGKVIAMRLVRDVEGEPFIAALEEALAPRLSISGEMAVLEDFKAMFLGRTMAEGSTVALLWSPQEDSVDVALLGPCDIADMKQVVPDKRFKSAALCRALLEVWLGERAVIPDARASFAQGVAQLIETDETARAEWKPGGRGTDKP